MPRDDRQKDLVPPDRLSTLHAIVVGVGAVGRQVSLQLAAVGIPSLTLIDHDTVEEVNLGPQAYFPVDVGLSKVACTRALCRNLLHGLEGDDFPERFRQTRFVEYMKPGKESIVFCCVDSMEVRKNIWETSRKAVKFFADSRVGGDVIRVLTSTEPVTDTHYETTLFTDEEAFQGSCTAKMTVFRANLAAGLMLEQWSKWLRGTSVESDLLLALTSMELET